MPDMLPIPAAPPPDTDDLEWLGRIHLFRGLPEDLRRAFLERAQKRTAEPGEWLIEYADSHAPFILLQKGRAEAFTRLGDHPLLLGILEAQDHAGAEAIVHNRRSPISVRALRPTVYFRLEGPDLLALAQSNAALEERLRLVAESRARAREQRPLWLPRQEWVQVFVRRHSIIAWGRTALILGVGILLSVLLLWLGVALAMKALYLAAGLSLLGTAVAIAWNWLEWSNDYYIITTRRVASVERVFPIHDSRHEVPITMVNAAEVETGFWGRRFHFGAVIARTWTEPPLVFHFVRSPQAIGAVLDELIQRIRLASEYMEKTAIQQRLRERLGMPLPEEPEAEPVATAIADETRAPTVLDAMRLWGEHIFGARLEEGDTITYRKHWIFLLRRALTPSALVAAAWGLFFWRIRAGWVWPSFQALLVLVLLTTLGSLLALIYQAWDWANDIYQISATQVRDIKAVPLGEVQRKIAPLDKIVSVDFERPSFWARVFNYGNVTVQVGPEEPLIFYRVWHPDQVQQDLFLRMDALRRQQERVTLKQQQEGFLEWLAAYHELTRSAAEAPEQPPEPVPAELPPLAPQSASALQEPSWEEMLDFNYDPWTRETLLDETDEEEADHETGPSSEAENSAASGA